MLMSFGMMNNFHCTIGMYSFLGILPAKRTDRRQSYIIRLVSSKSSFGNENSVRSHRVLAQLSGIKCKTVIVRYHPSISDRHPVNNTILFVDTKTSFNGIN